MTKVIEGVKKNKKNFKKCLTKLTDSDIIYIESEVRVMKYYTIEINGYVEQIFVDFGEMMDTYKELTEADPTADIVWGVEWD